jgi:hypothetical protein
MAWRFRPRAFAILNNLSLLTSRLIRLGAYAQLERGEAQIRAAGVPADLISAYRNFAYEESRKIIEEEQSLLVTRTTQRSTF